MDKYTASNGLTVSHRATGTEVVVTGDTRALHLSAEKTTALREFFRAEEDERLGRWRWREYPEYVVYPRKGIVRVHSEVVGDSRDFTESGARNTAGNYMADAAVAYMDAHSEPKYTTAEWVAKAMYEGQAGVPWEEARDEDRNFWLGSAADAIAKYEEMR